MDLYRKCVPESKRINEYFIEEAKSLLEKNNKNEGLDIVNRLLQKDPDYLPAIIMKINYLENNDFVTESDQMFYDEKDYALKSQLEYNELYSQSQVNSDSASSTSSSWSNPSEQEIKAKGSVFCNGKQPLLKLKSLNNHCEWNANGGNHLEIIMEGEFVAVSADLWQ